LGSDAVLFLKRSGSLLDADLAGVNKKRVQIFMPFVSPLFAVFAFACAAVVGYE
jgi:hypothetical protein